MRGLISHFRQTQFHFMKLCYPQVVQLTYCYNNKFKLLILKVLISEARVKFNCGELASNSIEAELTAKKE